MRSTSWLPLCAATFLGFSACDSSATTTIDQQAQARIEAIRDCFPDLWEFADGVLTIAEAWKLDGDENPEDPTGLSWSFTGLDITAELTVGSSTVTMVISAYGPNGTTERRSCSVLSAAGSIQPVASLSEAIDNIASELRDEFDTTNPFLLGVWSIGGGGISASSEGLLGIIGGSTNANELQEVRTVDATVTTGAPAVDSSVLTDTVSSPACTLTFSTDGLVTDEDVSQDYPSGTIEATVNDGTTEVSATITFDKTEIASIVVEGLTGAITLNLETLEVTL
ncbi:MAG: hypothetical protein AB8H80_00010 [Planctomycetota bacterium]